MKKEYLYKNLWSNVPEGVLFRQTVYKRKKEKKMRSLKIITLRSQSDNPNTD